MALAEMFETQNYFGTVHTSGSGVGGSGGGTRPSKRRRIATPDPEPPLACPSPHPTPDPEVPSLPGASTINPDEALASHWTGYNNVGDSDDDLDFEGHPIPHLMEISDDEDEESEFDLEDWWDDRVAEDLLEVLEMNVELDACNAGVLCL